MKLLFMVCALAIGTGTAAIAADAPKPGEASIPFVNHGGIENWQADGRDGIYVQDIYRKWYHATFMGPCTGLPFAETIGFETRGPDTLDRFGTVVVNHQKCAFRDFVRSAPPPKNPDTKNHRIDKVEPAPAVPGK